MIVLDANILIYAVNADAPSHAKTKAWLESVLSKRDSRISLERPAGIPAAVDAAGRLPRSPAARYGV